MASHHLLEVEEICDEVVLLHGGVVRARGTLDELLAAGDEHTVVVRGLADDRLDLSRLGPLLLSAARAPATPHPSPTRDRPTAA